MACSHSQRHALRFALLKTRETSHTKMNKLKSEVHHWWPKVVSKHWVNENGGVHWLSPNGTDILSTPDNFGGIGNGHHIKLGGKSHIPTSWDESFEDNFDSADANFTPLIEWLEETPSIDATIDRPIDSRILSHGATDEQFSMLIECIFSLAVRSPMFRSAAIQPAKQLRGSIPSHEKNAIIGLSIRNALKDVLNRIRCSGKAMIAFSREREFLFGDGFFSNLRPPISDNLFPKLFVPLTPRIAVLFARPASYITTPRLVTLALSKSETDTLNQAVQVYAKDAIFYRSEKPTLTEHFKRAEHLIYENHNNPVDGLIHRIPGVLPPYLFGSSISSGTVRMMGNEISTASMHPL